MISLGYTAAVITVIGSDFLPRVSRVRGPSPVEVSRLVLKQIRLLTSVLVPLLVVTSAVLPLAVTILYRSDFAPTVSILEWQLVGDLFRGVGRSSRPRRSRGSVALVAESRRSLGL